MPEHEHGQKAIEGPREDVAERVRQFWEEHGQEVQRFVETHWAPWLARRESPEDVLQSIFRSFHRRLKKGSPQGTAPPTSADNQDLTGLLWIIAKRKIAKKARSHQAGPRDVHREVHVTSASVGDGDLLDGAADRQPTPAEAAEAIECLEEMRRAIESLEGRQRQVVEMTLDGRSCVEIAGALGISDSIIRRHLRHAKGQLARELDQR